MTLLLAASRPRADDQYPQLRHRHRGVLGVHAHRRRAADAGAAALQPAWIHAGAARVSVPPLRVLRHRHESPRRLARGAHRPARSRCCPGWCCRSSRSCCSRGSIAGWSMALSVAYVMGASALRHREGSHEDEREERRQGAGPAGRRVRAVQVGRGAHGSKNALKGVGFFLGGFLLSALGFRGALDLDGGGSADGALARAHRAAGFDRPGEKKAPFTGILSNSAGINRLSLARLALFAARDVWFVVSVPIFLSSVLGWSFTRVGGFMALWVIAYGGVQSASPVLFAEQTREGAGAGAGVGLGLALAAVTALIPIGLGS